MRDDSLAPERGSGLMDRRAERGLLGQLVNAVRAGRSQVLSPMLNRAGRLPAPQQEALLTAFGVIAGPPPDRGGLAAAAAFLERAALQGSG